MALGRKTGGRKPGVKNRFQSPRKMLAEAGISAAFGSGVSPLDIVLLVARNGPGADAVSDRQLQAAMAACPYVHPRLNSTSVSGFVATGGITHEQRLDRLAALEAGPPQIDGEAKPMQE